MSALIEKPLASVSARFRSLGAHETARSVGLFAVPLPTAQSPTITLFKFRTGLPSFSRNCLNALERAISTLFIFIVEQAGFEPT